MHHGLGADELAALLAELGPRLIGARVRDLSRLRVRDDLLLFLDLEDGSRCALQLAPGGPRARICTTRRRFARSMFATGPLVDRLKQRLEGTVLRALTPVPGERSCRLVFRTAAATELILVLELFGARGLWCLLDAEETILELSRLPNSKMRMLRPGTVFLPPAASPESRPRPEPRFVPPLDAAIDAHYTPLDRLEETQNLQRELRRSLVRARTRCQHRIDGLQRQQTQAEGADQLRQQADLLLAYGFAADRTASEIEVPDPVVADQQIVLPLRPGMPIQKQAERLYQKARKLEDGRAKAAERLAASIEEAARLDELRDRLAADPGFDDLMALRALWVDQGLLRDGAPSQPKAADPARRQLHKITKGHNLRIYRSQEGHLILVGRNNQQNDRLSISVARGSDYWFHVGQGYAGSHVVLRLPKEKTPSLESLLDAATLAVHFSKARQAHRCEVIYCQARHVRKPKGLPPGKVIPAQTKTLAVDMDAERLARLLADPQHSSD